MRLPLRRLALLVALAPLALLAPTVGAQEAVDLAPRAGGPPPALLRSAPPPATPPARLNALLYDNGPLVNSPGTGAGGADESVVQYPLNVLGFNHNYAAPNYRLADDFVVPSGGWNLTDFVFYAYQDGSSTTSTITTYVLRIWDGQPGEPGSAVIFGNLTTNRLETSVFSNIYRRDRKEPPGTAFRPVMRSTVNAELALRPGTYWVEWGATGSLGPNVWAPPTTINGQTDTGNALQFVDGAWRPAQDQLYEQGFPFQILGGTGAGPFLAVSPMALDYDVQIGSSDTETVTLTSNGSAPITITSITASGDPAFAVNLAGTDLTLNPGQSTTFTVTFAPTEVGPATGAVSIVSNDPASPQTVALSGVGTTFVTYASTDTPLVIPDCSGFPCQVPGVVTSTLTVPPGSGRIQDLDLDLDLPHLAVGNIIATLTHGATSATVIDRPGVPASDNGCGANNFNIVLDDEGTAGLVETGCIGLSSLFEAYTANGHYVPNNPLSAFDGMEAAGTWTLTVSDNGMFDHGTLDSWALLVTAPSSAPVTVSAQPVDPPVVIGAGGGSFAFTVTLTNTSDQPQSFEAWTAVTGPVSRELVLGPQAVTLPPGSSVTRTLTQQVPGAAPAGTYSYAVNVSDYPGGVASSASFPVVKEGGALAVGNAGETGAAGWAVSGWDEPAASAAAAGPTAFALAAAYPNPTGGPARLTLSLPEAGRATVAVFDGLGRRVALLHDGALEAGTHTLALDASAFAPGVYVVRAAGAKAAAVRRLVVAR